MKRNHIFFLLPILVFLSYLFVNGFGIQGNIRLIQIWMLVSLLLSVLVGAVLFMKKRLTCEKAIILLLWAGFMMRIGYMLYTPCTMRAHDLWELTPKADGNAGYLLKLLLEHRLPDSYMLQSYQQPLFYILGAAASKGLNDILGRTDMFAYVDGAKTISCIFSCYSLVLIKRLCEALHLEKKETLIGTAFAAFTPAAFLIGAAVDTTSTVTFFTLACVLFTIYWYQNSSYSNTVLLAFLYGLGMLSKQSCGVVAVFTMVVVVKKWKETKENKAGFFIPRYLVFLFISLPLGLCFSIRNFILFHEPLTYVLKQDVGGPLYTGDISYMARFVLPDFVNLLKSPYTEVYSDYNLPVYLMKSSLFGEFSFDIPYFIPILLLFMTVLLWGGMLFYVARYYYRKKKDQVNSVLCGLYILFAAFAIFSYFKYPFGCTMNTRYFICLPNIGGILLGKLYTQIQARSIKYGFTAVIFFYGLFSISHYLLIAA